MMKEFRVKAVSFALFMVLALMLAACGSRDESGNDPTQNADEKEKRLVPVRVQTMELSSLELTARATGVLRSHDQIPISPEISGTVVEKFLEVGDAVAAGEAILQLDPEPYELALAQAEASFSSAQVAYDQAQRDYMRSEELHSSGDISEFELENAHLAEMTAKANLQMAEAALRLAERNLRLSSLRSPINGSVAQLNAQIGQQVSPGLLLGMVVSLDHIEVEVGLSERDIVNMKPGLEVRVWCEAFPGREFGGKVRNVGIAGLDLSRTFPVIAEVENTSGLLKPGMIVNLSIIHTRKQNVLVIPRSALVIEADNPTLFVVDGEMAFERKVELGQGNDQYVIVDFGLSAGENLVIDGQNVLRDSSLVKIL